VTETIAIIVAVLVLLNWKRCRRPVLTARTDVGALYITKGALRASIRHECRQLGFGDVSVEVGQRRSGLYVRVYLQLSLDQAFGAASEKIQTHVQQMFTDRLTVGQNVRVDVILRNVCPEEAKEVKSMG
jgi:uncharacterized alkaline shock family protein YloU